MSLSKSKCCYSNIFLQFLKCDVQLLWNVSKLLKFCFKKLAKRPMYCKNIMIVNYDSSIVNKFGVSFTDNARVVIYDRNMLIVQATGLILKIPKYFTPIFQHFGE